MSQRQAQRLAVGSARSSLCGVFIVECQYGALTCRVQPWVSVADNKASADNEGVLQAPSDDQILKNINSTLSNHPPKIKLF